MATPFVDSVKGFPSQVTMTNNGAENVSSPQSSGGASVTATLPGKVTTTFSLEHTNLSWDSNGKKTLSVPAVFAANTTQFIRIPGWTFHCPANQIPDPLVAITVTASYDSGPDSPPKSSDPIVVTVAKAIAPPKAAIIAMAAPVTRVAKAVLARATGRATPKSAPKKRAAKSTGSPKRRTSKPAASSKKSTAKPTRSQPKSSAAKATAKKSPRKSRPASTHRAKGSKGRK